MNDAPPIRPRTKSRKTGRTVLIMVCAVIAAVLVAVIGYLLYVVGSYYRVEDDISLSVAGEATGKAPVGEPLRLVTYNIGFGAYSADYSFFMDGGEHARAYSRQAVLDNIDGAIATVKNENPHFALFQEVDVDGTRSYHVDETARLAEALPTYERVFGQNYDSPYFLYPFHEPIGANRSGLVTFSAFDITDATRRSLPIEESLYKYLDLDRAYTVSRIPTANGKTLVLYNLHLSAYTSDGTIADEQLRLLAADMAAEYEQGNYIVAAGDFNKDLLGDSSQYFTRGGDGDFTWAKPFDRSLLPAGFSLHTGSNAPTCRNADSPFCGDGTDFVLSVDGVIVSDNVEVIACETMDIDFAYSDHDPVRLAFILQDEQKEVQDE